jgi:hypothetical protein
MKKTFLLTAFFTILLFACRKDVPSTQPNTTEPQPNPTGPLNPTSPLNPNNTITPSVYIAGDSFDVSTQHLPYPVYWKNGKLVQLPHPGYSSCTGIAVGDSTVYVSNRGQFYGNNVTYWKNEIGINLDNPTIISPTATSTVLSDNNIYTAGSAYTSHYEKIAPIYWKNQDEAIKLPTHGFSNGYANSIAVAGNDIFIAGYTFNPSAGYNSACYWKNGVINFMHSTTIYESGEANSVFLSDTNIHIAGKIHSAIYAPSIDIAVYWKNGKATELTDRLTASVANSIFVQGNDVYIAGGIAGPDRFWRAAYWKNGVATILESKYSVANAITVFENDVYIAGNRGIDTALYWKNNKPVILGRGRANAIVVKK